MTNLKTINTIKAAEKMIFKAYIKDSDFRNGDMSNEDMRIAKEAHLVYNALIMLRVNLEG